MDCQYLAPTKGYVKPPKQWTHTNWHKERIMSKFGRKNRNPPDGYEYIEETLNILDAELRESKQPHCGYPTLRCNMMRSF